MIEFNINKWVYVKLNETGKAELKKQWTEMNKLYPQTFKKFKLPNEDVDGFSKWQMHSLMQQLGHLCVLGFEPPFDPDIKLAV